MALHSNTPEMKSLLESVVEQVDNSKMRIVTESDFKTYMLPVALATHLGEHVSMAGWVNLAGEVTRGVKVVDNYDRNKVLFTTPGIYAEASFTMEGGMTAMITEVAECQKLRLDPEIIYAKHLNENSAKLSMSPSDQLQTRWYAIFAKYGYKMDLSGEDVPTELKKLTNPAEVEPPKQSNDGWADEQDFA